VLTQEYELAKVQEAREIPTVKVLDPADIPERKKSAPRLLIAISTMCLFCIGGIALVLGSKSWNDKAPSDLSKAVATEIWIDLKGRRFLSSGHGTSHEAGTNSAHSLRQKRSIFSFLGSRTATHNGNGSYSSSDYVSEKEPGDKST